jgi:chromosome segregation ATPase
MTKLVNLLGRAMGAAAEKPAETTAAGAELPAPAAAATPPQPQGFMKVESEKAEIDLDNELFFPLATQLGQENETVRNLLIDAEHKIAELDNIKRSIGKLVDPVSKTLRAFEEAKSERISLQNTLNSTRLTNSKLRDELAAAEKRANALETEAGRLRELVVVAQQSVETLEATKTEHLTELNARRTQITDLQRRVQEQGNDLQITRDENRRITERAAAADKRSVQLEGEAQAAKQRAMLAEEERASVQTALDRALAEYAQTARRLAESDKALATATARLKVVEATLAEAQMERNRLSAALEEATQAHRDEMQAQMARFEALQARSDLSDNLLEEARQALLARNDEIRAFDQRIAEAAQTGNAANERVIQLEEELAQRDIQLNELEQQRSTLTEQNQVLARAVSVREGAYNRAQEKIQAQTDLIALLESQLKATRESCDMQVEELQAQVQRERLERTMAEGALEAGRKDIARLLRELSSMQYRPGATQVTSELQAAAARMSNAA